MALGEHILSAGRVPDGIPFAQAPTHGWANVPVLAEVILAIVGRIGASAPVVLAVLLTAAAWLVLSADGLRSGASDGAMALVIGVVMLGSATTWGVIRLQTLSLLPFALLVLVLRREADQPSRRIWTAPALVACWGNLHGAVLVGIAITGAYLVARRLPSQPWTALGVGVATVGGAFVNPAGWRTLDYYRGVLTNDAARSGSQLWAAIDLGDPSHLLLALAVCGLGTAAVTRLRRWELVASLGLLAGTLHTARMGVWLLLFLVGPAAGGVSRLLARFPVRVRASTRHTVNAVATVLALAALVSAGTRTRPIATLDLADPPLLADVATAQIVLAPAPLVEALAVCGVTVWVSDPIDAFTPADQSAYLAFLSGAPGWVDRIPTMVGVVIVTRSSPQADELHLRGFIPMDAGSASERWTVYRRP